MKRKDICYMLMVLVFIFDHACTKELNKTDSNATTKTHSRMPRENHVFYNPTEDYSTVTKQKSSQEVTPKSIETVTFQPEVNARPEETKRFEPSLKHGNHKGINQKHHHTSPERRMSKSLSNLNWNIWNGDASASSEFQPPTYDMSDVPLEKFENYHYPRGSWKDTPFNNARMAAMLQMMNELQEPKIKDRDESKPTGFISKITTDPSTFLLMAAIPVTILLSAVLPVLMDNANNFPMVYTIATGSKGRMLLDSVFTPIFDGASAFGYRALEDPGCTQRIFCQVLKGSDGNSISPSFLQRALYKASRSVDESYLDSCGVKTLVDALSDGSCEKVPCTHFNLTDYVLNLFSKEKKN